MIAISVFFSSYSSAVIIPNELEAKRAIAAKNSELVATGKFSGAPDMPAPAFTARKDGYYQFFQGYGVWYEPFIGAFEVNGDILAKWRSLNFENGPLGYPTNDETLLPDNSGEKYSAFETGFLVTTPTGIRWVERIYPETAGTRAFVINIGNIRIDNDHNPLGPGKWNIFASLNDKGPPRGPIHYIHINDFGYTNMGLDSAVQGRWYEIAKADSVEVKPNQILSILITGTQINGLVDPPDSKDDCFGPACPEADDVPLGEVRNEFGPANNYGIGLHCGASTLGDYYICYTVTEVDSTENATEFLPFQLRATGACTQDSAGFDCDVSGAISNRAVNKINCDGVLLPTNLRVYCSTNNGQPLLCNTGDLVTFRCKYA